MPVALGHPGSEAGGRKSPVPTVPHSEEGGYCRKRSWTKSFSTGESAESGNRSQAGLTPATSESQLRSLANLNLSR